MALNTPQLAIMMPGLGYGSEGKREEKTVDLDGL
jgi:hypothetical protein